MGEIAQPSARKRGAQAIATNYYGVGGDSAMIHHVHLIWDTNFAGVFTFETSDVTDLDPGVAGTAGQWIPEASFSASGVVGGTVASNPATPGTPASVTVVAGNPGGASLNFTYNGARIMRVKCVCTTGGQIEIWSHGKF